ncbi:hypothetical protein [Nitratireductor alexandrii]|uniref:hypothetical protein n=1 Tax=Nitratireductor alexandrii TaxID=2448161 RepID=UPI003B84979A
MEHRERDDRHLFSRNPQARPSQGFGPSRTAREPLVGDHHGELRVEPISRHLPLAPSTCYDHLAERVDPERLSDRARRDGEPWPEIERVFEAHFKTYGERQVWRQMRREGFNVALESVLRGKKIKTMRPDKAEPARWRR